MAASQHRPLRIIHVFRAPLGGLFRHVVDLTREQVARGHAVGVICDSTTGGDRATQTLAELSPGLSLGVWRTPMRRLPHFSDLGAFAGAEKRFAKLRPDVIHGHGAKGGFYARAPGLFGLNRAAIRCYTPHGGSFNYKPGSFEHRIFMGVESTLARATDLLLFESAYIANRYDAYVGIDSPMRRVIVNGVSEEEMRPIEPNHDATDLLYIGELRSAKGIDTLLDAMALVRSESGAAPTLTLVGSGPDQQMLLERARLLGLEKS
ncbi:MAG: glycosyltransferase, partial [Hyphomicrobiales bacterium]|nr:glycosyltransferase [Hyphomicrobiales bacterium]